MICKTVEIRDRGTFIPAMAIQLKPGNERDRYLFGRSGYGISPHAQAEYVILVRLAGGMGHAGCDPYDWPNRTLIVAHQWLIDHFDEIESGHVVDVEFISGFTKEPKRSEQETQPL